MGRFYVISFSKSWIVFACLQKCWLVEQVALLFSSLRNSPSSLFNNLDSIVAATPALGIHLKPQSA
jgi:hypothetical protein